MMIMINMCDIYLFDIGGDRGDASGNMDRMYNGELKQKWTKNG